MRARVCVCISCVWAPGCSTAARICSFLCAAHSAACLLLPPLRKGIPCRLRYCCSQSVSVETREEEEEDNETCRKATLTDRGQSGFQSGFFLCEDVQRLFTRKTLCVRDLLLTFVPLNCAHMWEGTLCIHVREWQSVCVWVSDCVACECLFPMRSERASRVCIVVLEEVEEDESCSSSPPPRPKSSPDRRSHHASRKVAAEDDKVRWDCLLNL